MANAELMKKVMGEEELDLVAGGRGLRVLHEAQRREIRYRQRYR